MSVRAKQIAVRGWHFVDGEMQYYVGAPDAASAKEFVSKHSARAAKLDPAAIPIAVVRFLGLKNGTVATARIFSRWKR
jgi:hypothetical protein